MKTHIAFLLVVLFSVSCKDNPLLKEQITNETTNGWSQQQALQLVSHIHDWVYRDLPFPGLDGTDESDISRLRGVRGLKSPLAVVIHPDKPTWPPSDKASWQFFCYDDKANETLRLSADDVKAHEVDVIATTEALLEPINENIAKALQSTNDATEHVKVNNELQTMVDQLLEFDRDAGYGGLRFDRTNLFHYTPKCEPQHLWGNKITVFPVTNSLYNVSIRTEGTSNFRFTVTLQDKGIIGHPPVSANTQVD